MAKQVRSHSRTFFAVLFAVLVLVTTLVSANVVLGQDTTPPTITKSIPELPDSPQYTSGENTYVTSGTTLRVRVEGAESGVGSCSITVTDSSNSVVLQSNIELPPCSSGDNDFMLPNSLPDGAYTISATATDNAGNTLSATGNDPMTVILDNTGPSITVTSPVGIYILDQPNVVASYSCDDGAGSGVASCVGDPSNGAIIDTSSAALGSHNFIVTATDNLGNSASETAVYSVQYSVSGVLPPLRQVSDPNDAKTYKLGRTLPIKFQLRDAEGAFIGTAKATLALYDANIKNSGKSNGGTDVFRYDPVAQQYIYNLSTKNLSQGIYKIVITLEDGTEISTYFRLGK